MKKLTTNGRRLREERDNWKALAEALLELNMHYYNRTVAPAGLTAKIAEIRAKLYLE
jgi:hypothetical protein